MRYKVYFSALLAAVLMFSTSSYADNLAKPKKEVCIQLYSLRTILDGVNKDGKVSESYTKLLKDLADMGYTSVETANYDNGKFYGRTPQQFKEDCEKAGLKVLSAHTNRGLSDQELASGDFTEAMKWWKQCIADHKAAGMEYIVCPWMGVPKTMKDLLTQCKYLNEIGKLWNQIRLPQSQSRVPESGRQDNVRRDVGKHRPGICILRNGRILDCLGTKQPGQLFQEISRPFQNVPYKGLSRNRTERYGRLRRHIQQCRQGRNGKFRCGARAERGSFDS